MAVKRPPMMARTIGRVKAIYEKSLIYQVPDGFLKKDVRLPISACQWRLKVDDTDIMVQAWLVEKLGLPCPKATGVPFGEKRVSMPGK